MIRWVCSRCREDQVAFRQIPEERLCHTCEAKLRAAKAFTEDKAGIPKLLQGLTRESWAAHFQRPWPEVLSSWSGAPRWVALWGPTGTGKTGIATVLLAEHLRGQRHGRWISGPELARRIQRDFNNAEAEIAPLLITPLLVLDEPLTGSATAGWYIERLILITRTRDEACRSTIVTSQLLPELLREPTAATPPPLLSRWLSGLHIRTGGSDVRLRKIR